MRVRKTIHAVLGLALAMAAGACAVGGSTTTLNVGGKYRFAAEAVTLTCSERTTGISISMTPMPAREFIVDVTRDGGAITLNSLDFVWNMINLRVDGAAVASASSGAEMTGTVDDNGDFTAQSTDTWTNTGTAGPVEITQKFSGRFTDTGVAGSYSARLILKSYNNAECQGSAGFTGEKLD